ncbi:MAG: hypothetical protein J0H48_04575 [Nitrosospira multiformis]|nr:hypothetical protein [Nitrosospira multiformis]
MDEKHWLDYLTGIGSIATPVLVLALTAVGWRLRRKLERRIELEDKLRDDRINIYNQILEPFIMLLMTDAAWQYDKQNKGKNKNDIAVSKMLSFEYRKQGFKLSLIGSDQVVIAYNDLMQYFYTQGDSLGNSEESLKIIMSLLGKFLLQIRRSMGNDMTQLNHWQMLEWFMVDARKWH